VLEDCPVQIRTLGKEAF